MSRFALDYDKTYTLDPGLWDAFIAEANARGHAVVCVTMRRPDEPISPPIDVIYTSRKAKVPFMRDRGEHIDVWIDDSPAWLFQDG